MELKEIRQALKNETDNPYQFGVFCDGIMTYDYVDNGLLYELNIIADDTFFPVEELGELINKDRIAFLCYRIILLQEDGDGDELKRLTYVTNLNPELN